MQQVILKNKRLYIILGTASIILLVPLVAMQFTSEVQWTLSDFLIGAVLLLGTGLLLELLLRVIKKTSLRIAVGAAILLILLLVWAELAVGIFGTPFAGS